MRVLLTGAAGFIGSHLAERLLARGHEVVGLDAFDPFYDPALKERNVARMLGRPGFTLARGDILDSALVARLARPSAPVDVCCHLAALAGVRPSVADPLRYHRVNVDGTLVLLEACRAAGVPRFVFASSSSVYGVRSHAPFREDDACDRPASPYGATKRAGEHFVHAYHHVYGLDATCLRFFTVYGPRQRPEMAIAKFARLIEAGAPVPLFGDLTSARDYTWIDDIVEGAARAVERPAGGFAVYNLGDARTTTLAELVRLLERALGKRAVVEPRAPQIGDVPLTCADIAAARRDLGYEPRVAIEEGIERYVRWVREAAA